MKGVYLQKNSPYYWIRYYDKYEPNPSKKRKSVNTKIEVTPSDKLKSFNKQPLTGTQELRNRLKEFKTSLAVRNMEVYSGVKINKSINLSVLVDEYLQNNPNLRKNSRLMYHYSANKLIESTKDKNLLSISQRDYSQFVQKMKDVGVNETTQSTISKHLSVLFNYAKKQGYIKESIIKLLKAPPGVPEPIPHEDLITILNFYHDKEKILRKNKVNFDPAAIKEQKLLVFLMHYTGMRQSSILALEWTNFNFDNHLIVANNVKGRKLFYFPLHNKLYNLLKPIKKDFGKVITRKDTRLYFWDRDLKKLVKENKIKKKYQMYQLRDTFSTLLASSSVDVSIIQDLLNHSNIAITKNSYLLSDAERNRVLLNKVKFR